MDDQRVGEYAARFCDQYNEPMIVLARSDKGVPAALAEQLAAVAALEAGLRSRRELSEIVASQSEALTGVALDLVNLLVDVVMTSRAARVGLSRLIREMASEAAKRQDTDEGALADALEMLARTQAISSLAVDEDLLAENTSVYIDCRIIRDFRPAYEEDATHGPVGIARYVSQQRLRIRYWSEAKERVFEVTLRDEDLADLERWVFRAKAKLPFIPDPVRPSHGLPQGGG